MHGMELLIVLRAKRGPNLLLGYLIDSLKPLKVKGTENSGGREETYRHASDNRH